MRSCLKLTGMKQNSENDTKVNRKLVHDEGLNTLRWISVVFGSVG